tara:strand:- start:223 stop:684 length:462 start_codon:yes stop_codon:yes gene_type:complete
MKLEEYFDIEGNCELKDGVYNVLGSVHLIQDVYKLPFKFGIVTDSFWCYGSKLTSLEGCPELVGDGFECFNNKLTSLKGCPKSVGGNFDCSINKLTSLKGSPKSVGNKFDCTFNNLTSLKGSPIQIGGNFYCDDNLRNTKEYRQYKIIEKLRN